MANPLFRHAEARPDALALWTASERWTYGTLASVIAKTSTHLKTLDIEEGTRVAFRLPNEPSLIVLLWALWERGAVAVPISTRIPNATAVRHAQRANCSVLVTADAGRDSFVESDDLRVRSPEDLLDPEGLAKTQLREGRDLRDDQLATILFTSGSTGTAKAVRHTWGNHRYSAKGANANLPLRPGDRWLLSLPLYHVGGLAILVRCALAGAAVALPGGDQPLHEALRTAEATHVSLVATQLHRLLDVTNGPPPADLRAVLLGGGPIPETLLDRGDRRGWPLLTSYGCTEMASQVTATAPGDLRGDLATAGRRLPHRRLRIVDGEIQVKGRSLFQGYEATTGQDEPFTDEGWYRTGDRGHIDAAGRLHVLGRIDRMFVSGGENIQPEEIENALEQIDEVERAVVVSVPDDEFGQRPVAFVRVTDAASPPVFEDELRRVLPGFKIPDAFHTLPSSVEEAGLKIDRAVLRERARKLQES